MLIEHLNSLLSILPSTSILLPYYVPSPSQHQSKLQARLNFGERGLGNLLLRLPKRKRRKRRAIITPANVGDNDSLAARFIPPAVPYSS